MRYLLTALLATFPAVLNAQDANLSTVEIPSTVVGGAAVTATLSLASPAPSSGQPVKITSSSAAAFVTSISPKVSEVIVPAGQAKANFLISTRAVGAPTVVTITVVGGTVTRSARLLVKPPSVISITLASPSIAGSNPLTGTVRLDSAAPAASAELASHGGLLVALTTEGSEAIVPAALTVPAGQTSATFQVVAAPVTAPAVVKISAAGPTQAVPVATSLSVVPPVVKSMTLSSSTVTGGTPVTGKVILTGKAPAGGKSVALTGSVVAASLLTTSSGTGVSKGALSNAAATVTFPESVTVLAGENLVSFPITTVPVGGNTTVSIAADDGGAATSASLTVSAPVAASLSVQPQRVVGGSDATGTITLNGPAPSQGLANFLTTSNAAVAAVPVTVIIAAGQRTATFPITTVAMPSETRVTIAAGQSASAQATITVLPRSIASMSLNTPRVAGGSNVNGTVSINGAGPAGGMEISIEKRPCQGGATAAATDGTSNTIVLGRPAAIIPEGQSVGAFQLTTTRVDDETCFTVLAYQGLRPEDGSDTKTATLTVLPPVPRILAMNFPDLANATSGTGRVTGTVEFTGGWSSSSVNLTLSCGPAGLQSSIPVQVLNDSFSAGTSRGTFETFTVPVAPDTVATCSISRGGTTKTAAVTVLGPRIQAIELPERVVGGNSVTGTITVDRRAPAAGMNVPIDGNNDGVATVSRVAIPPSQTLGAFQITTTAVTADTVVTITASLNGTTRTATLTVTPP